MPVAVPPGVNVTIGEGNLVTASGPCGKLTARLHPAMAITPDGSALLVTRPNDAKENRALHGLTRSLLHNMVTGVHKGFTKELEVSGVGYRAQKQGNALVLNVGYSHQVIMEEPEGLKIDVPAPGKIVVSGCDKQRVGQLAAEIREVRPPEPYKGKGIRYAGEVLRRKEGKTGAKKK
jgi:large subunit ribosomal protein L6